MKRLIVLTVLLLMVASTGFAAPIVLRATNTLGEDHPMTMALRYMSTEIAKRTNGEVKLDVYPNSQLGGNKEMVEGVVLGTIDIAQQFAGTFSSYVPEMDILALPFLFKSEDALFDSLQGEAGDILAKSLEKKGFIPLTYFYGGARSFINNVRPINTPEDLKGLKIRVIGVKTVIEAINALGAIATPMSQSEVYSALQQGVLDGWENSPVTLYSLKLYEQSKYFSYSKHLMTPDLVALSKVTAKKLGEKNLAILKEVARDASKLERKLWAENEGKMVKEMTDKGWCQFNDIADLTPFIEKTKYLQDEYEAKYHNGLIKMILSNQK
ncbi:TRAP transporter substrate-binding protein [Pelobacter seleniigenes]|uniref:TRAP transporter substrate-binding protein n=1 Tax=Pelobacter seleniigenes TaxID=407188 RepID=UPI0004A7065F|nr:TRAP transporter substrate-binding protein [Pelobacter seleniigenes]